MSSEAATKLLGKRLREVREARGLSLRTVALDSGISASMLSQIETNKVLPSVQTLWTIVSVLGVSVDEVLVPSSDSATHDAALGTVLGGRPHPPVVARVNDTPATELGNGVTWRRIAVAHHDNVEAMVSVYPPGTASSADGQLNQHNGTEYGYILQGRLTLQVEFETYELQVGDSFSFDSTRPHRFENNTEFAAEAIWYILNPTMTLPELEWPLMPQGANNAP